MIVGPLYNGIQLTNDSTGRIGELPHSSSRSHRSLQLGSDLPLEMKKKLKSFLHKDFDIFAWRHEDMIAIDLKVSCHYLKIDPKVISHR